MNKLLLVLAILMPCGSILLARQASNDLPQRIDAGGHLLRLRVEGTGSPTVVMEIGLGGFLEEWAAVQPEVARFTRVAAYDRIGSQHTEKSLAGEEIVHELHTALVNAGLKPPYVLVGQSFGGIYVRLFAAMYPDEVAGLVLVDPSQEEFIAWMREHHPEEEFSKKNHKDWPEANGVLATLEQLKAIERRPDVPTVVITAAKPHDDAFWKEIYPVWRDSHIKWVESLSRGRHILAPESGHGIQVESPMRVVASILKVVDQARDEASRKNAEKRGRP